MIRSTLIILHDSGAELWHSETRYAAVLWLTFRRTVFHSSFKSSFCFVLSKFRHRAGLHLLTISCISYCCSSVGLPGCNSSPDRHLCGSQQQHLSYTLPGTTQTLMDAVITGRQARAESNSAFLLWALRQYLFINHLTAVAGKQGDRSSQGHGSVIRHPSGQGFTLSCLALPLSPAQHVSAQAASLL